MRLMLKLLSKSDSNYELQYYYHLQGFLYGLLNKSSYEFLHDKKGYKFFCFSNIFPISPKIKKGEIKSLLICSPDSNFINFLLEKISRINEIKIGFTKYSLQSISKIDLEIPKSTFKVIASTPIIIRIPRKKYEKYNILPANNYDYIYWKDGYPITLFISQIEDNLNKKYSEYIGLQDNDKKVLNSETLIKNRFIQKFRFKKQISTRIHMKGLEQIVIGSIWEFEFEHPCDYRMIRFALDTGFGERNSLGFGFMNILN